MLSVVLLRFKSFHCRSVLVSFEKKTVVADLQFQF